MDGSACSIAPRKVVVIVHTASLAIDWACMCSMVSAFGHGIIVSPGGSFFIGDGWFAGWMVPSAALLLEGGGVHTTSITIDGACMCSMATAFDHGIIVSPVGSFFCR